MIALPQWLQPDPDESAGKWFPAPGVLYAGKLGAPIPPAPDFDKSAGSPFTSIAHVYQVGIGVPGEQFCDPEDQELFSVFKRTPETLRLMPGTIVLEARCFSHHMEMWHWFRDGHRACLYRLPAKFTVADLARYLEPASTGMEDVINFMMANLEKQK
jgi:hypothetical protein